MKRRDGADKWRLDLEFMEKVEGDCIDWWMMMEVQVVMKEGSLSCHV